MAGGSLIGKIYKAFKEFVKTRFRGRFAGGHARRAKRRGCNPISDAVKTGRESHRPVRKPNTIAKSLAIGDPGDGYFAANLVRDTGGWAEDARDDEIRDAMLLLAQTEGIFAETAGGVTVAVARKLIEQGRIPRNEEIVLCVTGNGLKTQDAIADVIESPVVIEPSLESFEALGAGKPYSFKPTGCNPWALGRYRCLSKSTFPRPCGSRPAATPSSTSRQQRSRGPSRRLCKPSRVCW